MQRAGLFSQHAKFGFHVPRLLLLVLKIQSRNALWLSQSTKAPHLRLRTSILPSIPSCNAIQTLKEMTNVWGAFSKTSTGSYDCTVA